MYYRSEYRKIITVSARVTIIKGVIMDLGWIITKQHVIVAHNGVPQAFPKTASIYSQIMKFIRKKDKQGLIGLLHPEKAVEHFSNGQLEMTGNQIKKKDTGEAIDGILAQKVFGFINNGHPYTPYKKFLKNLESNPNKDSRDQLLIFLKHNNFPITPDGCFLAYKYVTESNGKLMDSYSKTFNNNPGQIVAMDRKDCDPDRTVTCSKGLHVAAYAYAKDCGGGSTVIQVKVNPKDVVAVPEDHNNQKIRVCRYEVLKAGAGEVTADYSRISKQEIPSQVQQDDKINFNTMSGQAIIDYVKEKTGHVIPVTPKSKKSVIKHALKALGMASKVSTKDTIDLKGKSGKEIVDLVFAQTGAKITCSVKSKKTVLKQAWSFLVNHGLKVAT
jgi:hypothetical protein